MGEEGSAVPTAVCKMHTAKERGVLIFVKTKLEFYTFLTLHPPVKMVEFEWVKICGFIRYANILSKGRIS